MYLVIFLVVSGLLLWGAYVYIGGYLARTFQLRSTQDTPANTMRDGLDYEPARTSYLLPQHFSAIAAAGPIVGPILAGMHYGWLPAWLWVVLGGALVGGIHDFVALVGSVRHRAQSIAALVRRYMNPRAYLLFLIFVWFALIYVVIAFTDVTAQTFVAPASAAGGDAPGPGVATSSIIYLLLAVAMGAVLRSTGMSPLKAKMIFLPLVFVAIAVGPMIPIDLTPLAGSKAQMTWGYLLLAYCFFATLSPVWLLLQPRGELGGYFLYLVMGIILGGVLVGAVVGGPVVHLPAFKGWTAPIGPLFPILFITVACGACSGFHSIIASGTTSKQLDRECDARPVAYGSMLLESFFACMSLVTIMIIADPKGMSPNVVFSQGVATLARGILAIVQPVAGDLSADAAFRLFYQFGLLCFATFVFDTLDACTRLARYVLMEALRWKTRRQAVAATLITLFLPALVLAIPPVVVGGKPQPLWQVFWGIFGSSNQLLAALTLLGLTVWLARQRMAWWITFFPTVLMLTMTLWSLVLNIGPYLHELRTKSQVEMFNHVKFGITCSLIVLSVWLLIEAVITWESIIRPPQAPGGVTGEAAQPA